MNLDAHPVTLTVEQAAAILGISRALAYNLARCGDIPTVRLGRRLVVPRVALERLLAVGAEDARPA